MAFSFAMLSVKSDRTRPWTEGRMHVSAPIRNCSALGLPEALYTKQVIVNQEVRQVC